MKGILLCRCVTVIGIRRIKFYNIYLGSPSNSSLSVKFRFIGCEKRNRYIGALNLQPIKRKVTVNDLKERPVLRPANKSCR